MTHAMLAVVVPGDVAKDFTTRPTPWPDLHGADALEYEAGEALGIRLTSLLWKFDEEVMPADGTSNPDAKWDWWAIGGRWEAAYRDRQGERVSDFLTRLRRTAADLAAGVECNPHKGTDGGADLPWYFPHNLLTSDGVWHEIGRTGWWGIRDDSMTEAEWVAHAIEAMERENPADALIYIDFHI